MKFLGVLLVLIGVSTIVAYNGYLLKKHSKEKNLNKAIFIMEELVSFSPITIGFVLLGIGLLIMLK